MCLFLPWRSQAFGNPFLIFEMYTRHPYGVCTVFKSPQRVWHNQQRKNHHFRLQDDFLVCMRVSLLISSCWRSGSQHPAFCFCILRFLSTDRPIVLPHKHQRIGLEERKLFSGSHSFVWWWMNSLKRARSRLGTTVRFVLCSLLAAYFLYSKERKRRRLSPGAHLLLHCTGITCTRKYS